MNFSDQSFGLPKDASTRFVTNPRSLATKREKTPLSTTTLSASLPSLSLPPQALASPSRRGRFPEAYSPFSPSTGLGPSKMLPISSGSSVRKPYVAKAVSQSNIGPSATRKLSKATIAASQQSRSGSVAALAPTKKGAAALAIKKNDVKLTPTAFTMSMSRPASAASSTLTHPIRKYRSMDAIREENVPVTGNETVLPPSALRKNASRAQTPVTERKSVSFGNLTSIRNNKGDESEDEDDRSFELDAFVKPRRIIRAPTPGASKRPGSPKLKIPKDSALMTKIRVTDSTLLHGSMQTLQEDPDTELFIGRSKNQVEEFYPRDHKENEYILTPFQVSIYNKVNPPKDPERPSLPYKGPPLFISQAFKFDHQFRLPDLQAAANKVLSMYPILRTQFYRNEKIVDGDVQGLINKSDWRSLPADAVVEVVAPSRHSSLSDGIDGVSLTEFTTGWMRENPGFGRLYRILYVSDLNAEHLQKDSSEHVVFVGSTLIMDRRSLEWLVRETLKLYSHCNDLRLAGRFNSSIMEFLEAYECKERTSFATFSETCIESKFSMSFWRTQCIEVVQESIDHLEKDDLDGQIKKLELEKHNAKGSILSLSTRKTNIETDLNKLIEQRRRLDSGQNGEGEMYMFTDKRTNESIIISVEAKNELIKAAIGLDSATDTIVPFLDKHAVPKDVQRKIGASVLSVEGFAEMTDDSIQGLGILTRDRRKVLALRDHVATRIRDSFYEQQKIKSNLERRILKNKRDLDKINGMMSDAKEKLEVNDDMAMRLASILKPPIYEAHIPALTMRVLHTKLHQNPKTSNETYYGFIPFTIPQEILIQLRNFREGFMLSKKSATKGSDSSSTGMMSSDDSNEEDFDYKQGERQIKSVDAVCLAAFCVLLKHISGHEKFLLGFSQSYRSHDLLVGPLSDTVPLKVDMCKKRMPFESLFSSMHRAVFHARQQGAACPSSKIGNAFKSSKSLPVRFEVVSYKSTQAWLRKGMHVDDLLGKSDVQSGNQTRSIQGKRLWDVDETDDFNLKLVLVEGRNSISGGIRYQTDKFTEAQVSKWVSKYLSVLQSIEYAQRKISVSTIISRFYHSIWQGSAQSLASASFDHLTVAKLRENFPEKGGKLVTKDKGEVAEKTKAGTTIDPNSTDTLLETDAVLVV